MLDGLIAYLHSSWQNFLELKPIEQVSAFFGIAIPLVGTLLGYGKHLTRQLRLKREELHKLQELSENLREQIKELQRELKQKDETIAVLEAQFPEQWLKQAAKEREDSNEERAIRCLRLGFESLREPLSACCLDLAAHHFSLVSDYGSQHFAEAERLAQLAVLLRPADEQTGLFLAEIKAVAAEGNSMHPATCPPPMRYGKRWRIFCMSARMQTVSTRLTILRGSITSKVITNWRYAYSAAPCRCPSAISDPTPPTPWLYGLTMQGL
jgi:hypothetical protein